MAVNLHHQVIGQGEPVVLLHGLFGMGSNLGALARSLADDFTVYSVDLPNHGRSGWVDSMDLASMATAILGWSAREGIGSAHWLGHSLGGKIAMHIALNRPEQVRRLLVADIAPVAYPPRHQPVFAALEAVAAARCDSRRAAAALMDEHLEEPGVADFLLMSLARQADGHYDWRLNLKALKANYAALSAGLESERSFDAPTLFVKGEDSAYIRAEHRDVIEGLFPAASLKVIPGAGHWLHAQQPRLFNGVVGRFLRAAD
ncbi:MAG: alpha/beta fold hydrolase [Pseudomonadota bacterium]